MGGRRLVALSERVTDSDVKEALAPGGAPTHEVKDAIAQFSSVLPSNKSGEFRNGDFASGMQASVSHDLGKEGGNGVVHKVGGTSSDIAGDCMRAPDIKGFVAE